MIQEILKKLRGNETLSEEELDRIFADILEGHMTASQIGAFLMGLSQRGETINEIIHAAQALRTRASSITSPPHTIDCCGTGGDHSGSYNISTAVAFVIAACGIPVAKHGNRAASSQSGAADVLEQLGVNLDLSPAECETALHKFGFCFLMAPKFHSSLKPLAALRKELGFRTIFNLLGPLANPAGTKKQLIGVFDQSWVRPIAEALKNLGSEAALVVHGADGLDEITLTGNTYCAELKNGMIREYILSPPDFGLPFIQTEDIRGGDAKTNAHALMELLKGKQSAYRDIVLANAAAILVMTGITPDLKQAVAIAAKTIDNGKAFNVLQNYILFSKQAI